MGSAAVVKPAQANIPDQVSRHLLDHGPNAKTPHGIVADHVRDPNARKLRRLYAILAVAHDLRIAEDCLHCLRIVCGKMADDEARGLCNKHFDGPTDRYG